MSGRGQAGGLVGLWQAVSAAAGWEERPLPPKVPHLPSVGCDRRGALSLQEQAIFCVPREAAGQPGPPAPSWGPGA